MECSLHHPWGTTLALLTRGGVPIHTCHWLSSRVRLPRTKVLVALCLFRPVAVYKGRLLTALNKILQPWLDNTHKLTRLRAPPRLLDPV